MCTQRTQANPALHSGVGATTGAWELDGDVAVDSPEQQLEPVRERVRLQPPPALVDRPVLGSPAGVAVWRGIVGAPDDGALPRAGTLAPRQPAPLQSSDARTDPRR